MIYNGIVYLLTLSATVVFVSAFRMHQWIGYVLAVPFFYLFLSTTRLFVNYLIYLFGSPRILPEDKEIIKNGIPSSKPVVFFRPIFAKTNPEIETVLTSMKEDILNNQEPAKNMKFIVIDNTRDEGVKAWTRDQISKMQDEFGKDVVFYFHRNVKVDFFKKVGILHDAIMLICEGWTKPKNYLDDKWKPWKKETRNPDEPVWDVIMGDISALGIKSSVEYVLAGKDIEMDPEKKMSVCVVCDADNVWPKGSLRKLAAKILHPDNKDYTIYQPSIEVSNPRENLFISMNVIARMLFGFEQIVKWRIFNFSPFYGKGAMHVDNYVRDIIKSEWLHPGKAASHDFQEALRAQTVLMEDVYIWEKTFSNKLSELTRAGAWSWGDMETVRQFLFKPFEPGRKSHLQTLLRLLVSDMVLNVWLIIMAIASSIVGFDKLFISERLFYVLGAAIFMNTITPRFIVPVLNMLKKPTYELEGGNQFSMNIFVVLWRGIWTEIMYILISTLDMFYKPMAVKSNFMQQIKGKPFIWKTGAMSEIEMANLTVFKAYRILWSSTVVGLILLGLGIAGIIPGIVMLLISPFIASFVLGPIAIWATS